jgi:hypothetical protein
MPNHRRLPLLALGALALVSCKEPNAAAVTTTPPPGQATRNEAPEPSPPPAYKISTLCNLESVDGAAFGNADAPIDRAPTVEGWLAMDGTNAQFVLAREDKAIVASYPLQATRARPDVAQAFASQGVGAETGFRRTLQLEGVPAGRYHAYLAYMGSQGAVACDNGRHVVIQ